GELNSLAVNVVLGLVALARGVLLSRGVEIVINGSFEAASSPSVHPFSSFGLVFFCNLFRALSTGFYWVCALLCVLAGSVPPVQLLMSRLTYFRFSEKASDEESKLFLVTGATRRCIPVTCARAHGSLGALWTTSGDHLVPVFLQHPISWK
ncbi:unnamed protein product, partial [Brassica napus]